MEQDYIKLKQVKPAFAGYIRKAQELIGGECFPDEDAIHDARVLLKKARAVLKLTESQLNQEFAAKEKMAMKETGRIMASWRDVSVLRKTLRYLKKDNPDIFERLGNNKEITGLIERPEEGQVIPEDRLAGLETIRESLKKTSYRIRFEPMNNLDPQLLLKELESSYLTVICNFIASRNNTKQTSLHEFRKRTKDFLYQLWFFRPLNPSGIKTLEKKLDTMTQNLGKYNDLARLLEIISYEYRDPVNDPAMNELAIVIRNRQDQYLSKVWPVAYKVFCPGQNLVNILGFKLLII